MPKAVTLLVCTDIVHSVSQHGGPDFGFWLYSGYDRMNKLLVSLTNVTVLDYMEPTNVVPLIGCLLILGPHVNCFLFSMNNPKSEHWSLEEAKCEIITNIS